jgi:hypothetical protein
MKKLKKLMIHDDHGLDEEDEATRCNHWNGMTKTHQKEYEGRKTTQVTQPTLLS